MAEDREADPGKNLLAMGQVDAKRIIDILLNCLGDRKSYEERPNHDGSRAVVHIFKPWPWYVKLYFRDPECVFISVHMQNEVHK